MKPMFDRPVQDSVQSSHFFLDRQRKAINKAQSVQKMVIEAKFPDWDDWLNCFSGEQLFELLYVTDRKIRVVNQRLNGLLMMQAHLFSVVGQYSGPEQLHNPNTIFQPENGNSGFDWNCEYAETSDNLAVLDNEILHLQMQPQIEFPVHLIDYPTAVTPLQTWPPLLPNASIPSLPFSPPCNTPWPELINGGNYLIMDDDYPDIFSAMNDGLGNFRGL